MPGNALTSSRVGHVLGSAGWMAAARGTGLAWRLAIVAELGVADFGRFAVIIAAAGLVSAPIDQHYVVRTPRVDDATFGPDTAGRWWTGNALVAVGVLAAPVSPLVGLVAARAGADLTFNAGRSAAIRRGDPVEPYRWDFARQVLGIAAGLLVMVGLHGGILATTAAYVAALVVVGWIPARRMLMHRPAPRRLDRSNGVLFVEAVATAAYVQGDVVLVGLVASSTQAGYYALGTLAVWTLALVAQSYSFTFHESLRAVGGDLRGGPPWRHTVAIAAAFGGVVLAVAVALIVLGAPHDLWLVFIVLAAVAPLRAVNAVLSTVLVVQGRDVTRVRIALVATAVKAAGVVALTITWAAPGAALGFLLGDVVATASNVRALSRSRMDP